MGQKDASDGAGERLDTRLEKSNAAFVPLRRFLRLQDREAGVPKTVNMSPRTV